MMVFLSAQNRMPEKNDKPPSQPIPVTIRALQDSAKASAQGLATIYLPDGAGDIEARQVESDRLEAGEVEHQGVQEILSLTDDLMLTRMDVRHVPEATHDKRYALEYDGWR